MYVLLIRVSLICAVVDELRLIRERILALSGCELNAISVCMYNITCTYVCR